MKIVVALIVLCGSVGFASAQERRQTAPRGSVTFTPRLVPNAAPTPPWYQAPPVETARQKHAPKQSRHDFAREQPQTEIICGLTIIKKSPDADPGIFAQPKVSGQSAIRRIQPTVCNTHR